MITAKFDTKRFMKDMNNIIQYSVGFMEGAQKGKKVFLAKVGEMTQELLYEFIDANARVNPAMLHHIYEWERTGSPDSRIYDVNYTISNLGLSFRSSFRQSTSVQDGSKEPFYNKAEIMEQGIPVIIRPKKRDGVLVFEDDGETVFTRGPVYVQNPGGEKTEGGFEKTFNNFFLKYFTQAFLKTSGIAEYLVKPTAYKRNLAAGKSLGRSKGIETGYRWIANVGVDK
jgi:hypothetical protein